MGRKTRMEPMSGPQMLAIEVLASTNNKRRAAKVAGVDRGTIYNWLVDPHFVAALHRKQRRLADEFQRRRFGLYDSALAIVQQALDAECDPRFALEVLKHLERTGVTPGNPHADSILAERTAARMHGALALAALPERIIRLVEDEMSLEAEEFPGGLDTSNWDQLDETAKRERLVARLIPLLEEVQEQVREGRLGYVENDESADSEGSDERQSDHTET